MPQYQTVLYKAYYIDSKVGWDADADEVLFESSITDDPSIAMQELNFFESPHPNWFANMRMIENGEIVDEQWFDTSVIDMSEL